MPRNRSGPEVCAWKRRFADAALRKEILDAVARLESIQTADLICYLHEMLLRNAEAIRYFFDGYDAFRLKSNQHL